MCLVVILHRHGYKAEGKFIYCISVSFMAAGVMVYFCYIHTHTHFLNTNTYILTLYVCMCVGVCVCAHVDG